MLATQRPYRHDATGTTWSTRMSAVVFVSGVPSGLLTMPSNVMLATPLLRIVKQYVFQVCVIVMIVFAYASTVLGHRLGPSEIWSSTTSLEPVLPGVHPRPASRG